MSASAFNVMSTEKGELDLEASPHSQEFQKLVFAQKEVIMDRMRGNVAKSIDIAITSDTKKPVYEWRYTCCDEELVIHEGLLDLQIPSDFEGHDLSDIGVHKDQKAPSFIDLTWTAFKNFATTCNSNRVAFHRSDSGLPL